MKTQPKKSKFKLCKCGYETILMTCPFCHRVLTEINLKKVCNQSAQNLKKKLEQVEE